MKKILSQFLSGFPELNREEVEELSDLMHVISVNKNTIVVNEDKICNLCYFVLKGCLRQYVVRDGIEKTIALYTENQAVNFFTDQHTQTRAESTLCSIEDSILLVGNPETDEKIFARFPALVEITRRVIEADLGIAQKNISKLLTLTPEERYLNLMDEKPELLQRVPQHIIASFLGITPESLSRIRKRISQKQADPL